jgi:alcohol dehydrogenase (NADP+)
MAQAVREAISMGYRHIDCASVYHNEAEIGEVLDEVLTSGLVSREDLWITSKLWNDMHGRGDVLVSVAQSLRDLRLDYLDLYLVHWPFPNHHDPGVDVNARHPESRPYVHERYMEVWGQMERLVDAGLVRGIGSSNMTIPKLTALLRDCRIPPEANEMELHPHFQQPELFSLCVQNGIVPIGYSPLGSPNRPARDVTPGRHGGYGRPGGTRCSAGARNPPGVSVRQVGGAARPDTHPHVYEAAQPSQQSQGGG